MKALIPLLVAALLVGGAIGCGRKDKGKKNDEEKGPIDSAVEYATGYTAIKAKAKAERTTIQISIKNAVSMFEFEKGRPPNSLNELVTDGQLPKQYLNDEYGKPLESAVEDGALVVRSIIVDSETGQRRLNWEERF